MNIARRETSPGVMIRQIERQVVCRFTLSQQEAEPLQIARPIRHYDPPGILLVVNTGRIKAPAGILDPFRCVGPAMPNQLINALQKMSIGLGLEIERGSA